MAVHILGIRHHGVGSAKHVQARLAELQPDMIMVEGPVEIEEVFKHVGHQDLKPPVSIMVYDQAQPKSSIFYPFAAYSPEWVAIQYANKHSIPVRALDLPAAVSFQKQRLAQQLAEDEALEEVEESEESQDTSVFIPFTDPISMVAKANGFASGDQMWEYHFEHIEEEAEEHFEKVMHLMQSMREDGLESSLDEENVDREAYMRHLIRLAQNEMYTNIVIVCGAWHAPALLDLEGTAKSDTKLIKKLPKKKLPIASTWIPWTNGRLSMFSGYGAGITSPGWYEHLWNSQDDYEITWLTKVSTAFRKEGVDISTAHVIEAFRLSRSLAQLREKHSVQLLELNDAILSVMCMGDEVLLDLSNRHVVVGEALGEVPSEIPKMPLEADFEAALKKLRLKLSAAPKQHDLDLRKEIDLARSVFFHRLEILQIPWLNRTYSRNKGTFKESWMLKWSPEMMINFVDKAYLGNTVESAAQEVVLQKLKDTKEVNVVADLIQLSIPAELFDELDALLNRLNALSSVSTDVLDLIKTAPRLIEISRYGDVRKTDLAVLDVIIQQILVKINISLPNACYGLDDDNSMVMFGGISSLNQAIKIFSNDELEQEWFQTLERVMRKDGIHAIIRGCVSRLLLDANYLDEAEADRVFAYSLSVGNPPQEVAFWIEGFLKGSGMILIYDHRLWNLIYAWVDTLDAEVFIELLPMLRRSFSKFEFGERRLIGEKAVKGLVDPNATTISLTESDEFDEEEANKMIPVVLQFLKPV